MSSQTPSSHTDYITEQLHGNTLKAIAEHESAYVQAAAMAATLCSRLIQDSPLAAIPATILDAGCRYGYALDAFEEIYPDIETLGVELVPEFANRGFDAGRTIIQGDLHNLPLANCSFDLVFANHSLEHCHHFDTALLECARVAKHYLFIGLPLEAEPGRSHHTAYRYLDGWLQRILSTLPTSWHLFMACHGPTVDRINFFFYRSTLPCHPSAS